MATGNPIIDSQNDETLERINQINEEQRKNQESINKPKTECEGPFPIDLIPEDNFIRKFIEEGIAQKGGYEEFYFGGALIDVGMITNRNICTTLEPDYTYLNNYVQFIAESDKGKSQAIKFTQQFITHVMEIKHITKGLISEEKLYAKLQDSRNLIFIYGEMLKFYKMSKKNHTSGLESDIMEAYDCPDFISSEFKKETTIAENPFVSFLGGVQPATIGSSLTENDLKSGIWLRFMDFAPKRPLIHKKFKKITSTTSQNLIDLKTWFKEIQVFFERYNNAQPLLFTFTKQAEDLFDNWILNWELRLKVENEDDVYSSLISKMKIMVRKVVAILTICDNNFRQFMTDRFRDDLEIQAEQNGQGQHMHYQRPTYCDTEFTFNEITDFTRAGELKIDTKYLQITLDLFDQVIIPQKRSLFDDILARKVENIRTAVATELRKVESITKSALLRKVQSIAKKDDLEDVLRILVEAEEIERIPETKLVKPLHGPYPEVYRYIGKKDIDLTSLDN